MAAVNKSPDITNKYSSVKFIARVGNESLVVMNQRPNTESNSKSKSKPVYNTNNAPVIEPGEETE